MRILFLSLVALLTLSACERELPASMQPHLVTVEASLQRLLALPPDDDNWVIFTDEKTDLFVQFEVVDGSLVVEIPLIGRSKEQVERLGKVFQRAGVPSSAMVTAKDPKTLKKFEMRAYRAAFGADTTKAAIFAVRVFNEAYGLTELKIGIERNEAQPRPEPRVVVHP